MTKFIHIADLHIGRNFQALGYKAEKRKIQGLNLLRKICNYADENLIDIILIAGDFIEASEIRESFIDEIISILSKCKSKVFISCGNHDFNSIGSYYQEKNWSDNVHIFSDELDSVYLQGLNTRIYGASFGQTYQRQSYLRDFKVKSTNEINLMVQHGDITNSSDANLYNPISIKEIEGSGLDYLALGHIHKSLGIQKIGKTTFAYTGAVFSNSFNETGERTFIQGEFTGKILETSEVHLSHPLLINEVIELAPSLNSIEDLAQIIRGQIENKYSNFEDNFYRIQLTGKLNTKNFIDKDVLEAKFEDYNYLEIVDNIELEIDLETARKESSIRGLFIDEMINKIEHSEIGQEKELLERAFKIGLEALGTSKDEN